MPKLRNAKTDVGAFTQWLGRKCRNHNPLEELGLSRNRDDIMARATAPNIYKAGAEGDISVLAEDDSTLIYNSNGRLFRVKVEEVTEEEAVELQKRQKIAVGY